MLDALADLYDKSKSVSGLLSSTIAGVPLRLASTAFRCMIPESCHSRLAFFHTRCFALARGKSNSQLIWMRVIVSLIPIRVNDDCSQRLAAHEHEAL